VRRFNHIGLPTGEKQPGEVYVRETKVWVTKPNDHPYRIEFLRFEPDSPVSGPVRDLPHIAFQVDRLADELTNEQVLVGPRRFTVCTWLSSSKTARFSSSCSSTWATRRRGSCRTRSELFPEIS
jgi:hypothetical protein